MTGRGRVVLEDRLRRGVLLLAAATVASTPLVFSPRTYDQFEFVQALWVRLLVPVAVALWVLRVGVSGRWGWRRTPVDLPVALWACWLLAMTVFSVSPSVSWHGEYSNHDGTSIRLHYLALFFLVTQSVVSVEEAYRLVRAFVLGSVVACTYVLAQACGLDFLAWSLSFEIEGRYAGTLGNPLIAGALAMTALPLSAVYLHADDRARHSRIVLAGVCALAVVGWVALALAGGGGPPASDRLRAAARHPAFWALSVAVVSMLAQASLDRIGRVRTSGVVSVAALGLLFARTLLETGSRGAVLGILGSACIVPILVAVRRAGPRAGGEARRLRALAGLAAAAGGLVLAATSMLGVSSLSRLADSVRDPARAVAEARLDVWLPALSMWRERPLAGWGVDTFMTVFTAHETASHDGDSGDERVPQTAHSEPLQVLATLGLVGAVLWIAVRLAWLRAVLSRDRVAEVRSVGFLRWTVVASVVAYCLQASVAISSVPLRLAFWVLLAAACAPAGIGTPTSPKPHSRRPARARGLVRLAAWSLALVLPVIAVTTVVARYRADRMHAEAVERLERARQASDRRTPSLAARAEAEMERLAAWPSDVRLVREQLAALREARTWLESAGRGETTRADVVRTMWDHWVVLVLSVSSARHADAAVSLAPHEPRYRQASGDVCAALYRHSRSDEWADRWFERGRRAYRDAIDRNPRNAFATASLARLWYLRFARERSDGAFASASRLYRRALEMAPLERRFLSDAVELHVLAGRFDGAVAIVSGVAPRDPRLARSRLDGLSERLDRLAAEHRAGGRAETARRAREAAREAAARSRSLMP